MSENNCMVDGTPTRDFYEKLMDNARRADAGSRLLAASMIMERCGDLEMSDVLRCLAGQMDFDDNEEACAAIRRNWVKLDALIADRKSHRANRYIKVLRDSEILDISNGEVTGNDYDYLRSMFCKNGLFDPDIFGGSGKIPFYDDENDKFVTKTYGTAIGHIQLPIHVVFESDYDIIAYLLQMTLENVSKVAKYECYLVLDQGNSTLKKFDVINEASYKEHVNAGEEFIADIGGNAIYKALRSLGYADEPERLAFTVVPVPSPIIRPIAYSKAKELYYSFGLNDRYYSIVTMNNRVKKMMELGLPDIIIRNESRMLDEAVNKLKKAAQDSFKHTHWLKSPHHNFMLSQLFLIFRSRDFALRRLTKEELHKTSDIESLNVFPEQIHVLKDGKKELISLEDVVHHNDNVTRDYKENHMTYLPVDTDKDHPDYETEKLVENADAELSKLENYNEEILVSAMKNREESVVTMDDATGMYVLVTV